MPQPRTHAEMKRIIDAIEAAQGAKGLGWACDDAGISDTTYYRWKNILAKSSPHDRKGRPKHAQPMPAGAAGVGEIPIVIVEDLILQQIVSGDRGVLIERIDAELVRLRADVEQKQEAVKRIEAFRRMLVPAEKGASG